MGFQLAVLAALQGIIAIWLYRVSGRLDRMEADRAEAEMSLWREIRERVYLAARVQDLERR